MTSQTSTSPSGAVIRFFSRYRGQSDSLLGPVVNIGDCLGTMAAPTWYDAGLEPRAGDLVIFEHVDGSARTKQLDQLAGTWWLVSNVMAMPLLPVFRVLGVVVEALSQPPHWPHPYPLLSRARNEQNVTVKQTLALHFENARARRAQVARGG